MAQSHPPTDKVTRRRRIIRSFEAKSLSNRRFTEKVADYVTSTFGSFSFAIVHVYWFALWIALNSNMIPGIRPFDPFPYGLLTMVVSLEAIFLSIFVLVSQNRAGQIASLRDELQLQVNLIAEEEITKALELLSEIRTKVGIKKEDPELARMLSRIDTSYIEMSLQKQIDQGALSNFFKAKAHGQSVSTEKPSISDKNGTKPTDKTEQKLPVVGGFKNPASPPVQSK